MNDILLVETMFTLWFLFSIGYIIIDCQRAKIRQLEKELRHGSRNLR